MGFALTANAQTDTINAKTNRLQTERLAEGVARYLVYNVDSMSGATSTADIWERAVSFGVLPGNTSSRGDVRVEMVPQ